MKTLLIVGLYRETIRADQKDQHTKSNDEPRVPKQMQTPKPDAATRAIMAQIIQLQQEMKEQ
eukprot:626671-Rhodomonas_salina.1